jgi:hypothetical protein
MKLPNIDKATIPEEKITQYLLSSTHPEGKDKAAFFTAFGFTIDEWQTLAIALIEHAHEHFVVRVIFGQFGARYLVEGALNTPDGRRPLVRVVWFIDMDGDFPRLVTAYPL